MVGSLVRAREDRPLVNFKQQAQNQEGYAAKKSWVFHGVQLLRCHISQLREASLREQNVRFEQGIPKVMPESMDDLVKLLHRSEYEDVSGDLPPKAAWNEPELAEAVVHARVPTMSESSKPPNEGQKPTQRHSKKKPQSPRGGGVKEVETIGAVPS